MLCVTGWAPEAEIIRWRGIGSASIMLRGAEFLEAVLSIRLSIVRQVQALLWCSLHVIRCFGENHTRIHMGIGYAGSGKVRS